MEIDIIVKLLGMTSIDAKSSKCAVTYSTSINSRIDCNLIWEYAKKITEQLYPKPAHISYTSWHIKVSSVSYDCNSGLYSFTIVGVPWDNSLIEEGKFIIDGDYNVEIITAKKLSANESI